jgi:hypothetical protein
MKIQTSKTNRFGQSVIFANEKVEFDKKGVAEVSKELGERFISAESETVFPEGKFPKIEKDTKVIRDSSDVIRENEVLKAKTEKQTAQIVTLENSVNEWKAKYTETAQGNGGEVSVTKQELSDEDFEMIFEIFKSTAEKNKEAAGGLELPEDEWKELKSKDLAIYLVKKVLYGEES